jgi:hypothetical protein
MIRAFGDVKNKCLTISMSMPIVRFVTPHTNAFLALCLVQSLCFEQGCCLEQGRATDRGKALE